jgi:23S rRNA G2445 N2-methylase RlmL
MVSVGVISNKGFEKVAVSQIREFIDKPDSLVVEDTFVSFNTELWDEIYRFCYRNQIANRVVYFIDKMDYSDDEDLFNKFKKKFCETFNNELLTTMLLGGADFRVSLSTDEHTDTTWIESEIGGILIDYAKMRGVELKVNLRNPIMNLYIHAHNSTAYIGIDLSGDLSKRDYKLFNNAVSLKGPTAFGFLILAGYKPKDICLNPSCYSGVIEIEAALYASSTSHRFYNKTFPFMKFPLANDRDWDKMFADIDKERVKADDKESINKISITGSDKLLSSITAAVKNAKVAGMSQFIDFRRIDMDWVDIKFEEKSVDKIVSFIPGSSKHDKNIVKDFIQLFYQAEYVLKDSGRVVIMCLSKDLLLESSKEHFELEKSQDVHSGSQIMHILFFKKKK